MKRLLALVATAGLAVGLYAATATGSQQAVTPAQLNAVKKQVAALKKDVTVLKAFINNCVGVVGVARFNGYHAKADDGSEIITTALDLTDQGDTPTGLLATIDPQCVQSNSLKFTRLGTRDSK